MIGRKKTLAEAILDLKLYSTKMSGIEAPDNFRIYVVEKHDKHIDALVMKGNIFLGLRAIRASRTFKIFDIEVEGVYKVNKYYGSGWANQLAITDEDRVFINWQGKTERFTKHGVSKNEEEKHFPIREGIAIQTGITYEKKHKKLISFILENSTKKK